MKRPGGGLKRNMLTLNISSLDILYNSYLPFLKQGGLFIKTEKNYKLGDEVFLLLTLIDPGEKRPVAGKVVWINPKGALGGRPAGIGVHFSEQDKGAMREKIDKLLTGRSKKENEKRTYTM
ncbi:MAG: PilZ domain-containing protein [Thiomargarita sp.]|nr:PilZ domain-containing protein [Thiomargarita sp.]